MDRRSFVRRVIGSSAATTLLAGNSIASGGSSMSNQLGSSRYQLDEAGPMIPPVPAILLSVNGMEKEEDEITVAWTFVINGKPPQIGISVENVHVSLPMIRKHGEFVLNVPTAKMIKAFDKVDMNSTRVADKFALSGLSRERARHVDAPAIAESPIHVECRVFQVIEVKPIRTVFLADVVATTVLAGACDENGRLNVESVDFFGMTAGSGEFYTMGEKIGHIGKSVGRSDIKY